MDTTYTDIRAAIIRVLSLTGITENDENFDERENYISELLKLSAGVASSDKRIHFRVFITSALLLQQDIDNQTISEANKVVFTGLQKPIESLLGLQKAYDLSQALEVPTGFTAQEFLDRLCGCEGVPYGGSYTMSVLVI